MKINFRSTVILIAVLQCTISVRSQEEIRDFLVLGVDIAQGITSLYAQPAAEGLMYGLTGGWYNSAVVRDKWDIELSIVTNGSYVPSDARTFTIDTRQFADLTTLGGEAVVEIPTILGGKQTRVTFVAQVEGELYQFQSPEGLGLSDTNLLPNAFLQAKLGLPKGTEVGFRIFPNITVDDVQFGLYGFSAQHQFSRWINFIKSSPVALSVMAAFTHLDTDYNFQTGGDVTGDNQKINVSMDSFLLELIASTKFKTLNFYGGLGYVDGNSRTRLRGTYEFQVLQIPLSFTNPFGFENDVSGMRANLGFNLRLGFFGLNAAYTFQGFNNISVAMNFNIK